MKYIGEAEPLKQAAKLEGAFAVILTVLNQGGWIARKDIVDRATPQEFRVRLKTDAINADTLDQLETLFGGNPGTSSVVFELRSPDGSVAQIQSQQRVRSTPQLIEAVRHLCGERAIEMAATA